jgi:histone acetyltransferase MYST1
MFCLATVCNSIRRRVSVSHCDVDVAKQAAYESYWKQTLCELLRDRQGKVSIDELSRLTSIRPLDVRETLADKLHVIKYVKGDYIIDASPALLDKLLPKVWKDAAGCGAVGSAPNLAWFLFTCKPQL